MSFGDVPARILDNEAVPRSEILAYAAPLSHVQADLYLAYFEFVGILAKVYEDDTLKYQITTFGHSVRMDLVKRIDGDCPECPECP